MLHRVVVSGAATILLLQYIHVIPSNDRSIENETSNLKRNTETGITEVSPC